LILLVINLTGYCRLFKKLDKKDRRMNLSANSIAERLINTVARAFYVDSVVVVLDALIREKYIREGNFYAL
jgi:hypothetical protein